MKEQGQVLHNMSAPPRSQKSGGSQSSCGCSGSSGDSRYFTTRAELEAVHHGLL